MSAQIIRKNGKPEYAVLPYEEYELLMEEHELLEDVRDYDRLKAALARGDEELVPAEIAHRLAEGESPIRVWREYRGLTVSQLAERAGITQAYLSQIEGSRREGKVGVIKALAEALGVRIDDLT